MAKLCRTCTQTMTNEYFYLNGSIFASARLQVKDVLQSCIPEMDLDLLPDSAICKNCMSALYIVYQFKTEAIKNEKVFQSKQRIRVKNFQALKTLNDDTIPTSSEYSEERNLNTADVEAFEVELDDLNDLKTEIVYDYADEDSNDDTEDFPENLEGCMEVSVNDDFPENEYVAHEDDSSTIENIKVLDCPLLVPISEKFEHEAIDEDIQGDDDDNFQDVDQKIDEKVVTKDIKQEEPKVDLKNFIQYMNNRKMRRDVKRPYKCTECDFRSDAKAGLIMHRRIHTGEKPFHCTKCLYKAKRKAHLDDHMKIHTGERPFRCTICGKNFITKQILKNHALTHTGEKPYRCLQCNFISRHKLTIANHVKRVHIGMTAKKTQPSICYVCGKCLAGAASLSTHMKIHTGVKSHLCELCGRYFREKGMLRNHLRVHTGEKPFSCTECNYTATRKAHLQDHMRTHNNHRDLVQCTECDKRYTTKLLLRKHMKDEHQTEIKEEPSPFMVSS